MKIACRKLLIYMEWGLFGYALFFLLNLFLFEFIAFIVALVITVASFLDNKNEKQHQILKRPQIILRGGRNVPAS